MLKQFDRTAVRNGALGVLMFVLPAYLLVALFAAGDAESPLWLLMAAALLFGSTFAGYVGARDYPELPMSHGMLSAGFGVGATLAAGLLLQAAKGDFTLTAALTALVILQIGIGLGCLGALLAVKGARPPK